MLTPAGPTPATVAAGGPSPTRGSSRRPFRTSDLHYLVQHYPHTTAAACARALGRTEGSLRYFIHQHPELRKQGRP